MHFTTSQLLKTVPDYQEFMTVEEMNARAFSLAKQYSFALREVGRSACGSPLYLLQAGSGEKKAFVWGYPHPNESIGSWTVDWLLEYFGEHPEALEQSGYTWYFMYTADPDGTQLNEGWFKGPLTLEKYILHFYRPPGFRQMEWTFPVTYKDFTWKTTLPETEIMMRLIDELQPDLMYPLHNAGLGAAYFFTTRPFDSQYCDALFQQTKQLGIPLDMGEPEVPFMKAIQKPLYYDFHIKDYYEHFAKIGEKPLERIKAGDNSSAYLLRVNPDAVVIKGEIPYFYDAACDDTTLSTKTRREIWQTFLQRNDSLHEFSKTVFPFLSTLQAPAPHFYVVDELRRLVALGNEKMQRHVATANDYDRKATRAEVFWSDITTRFYQTLTLGQLRRAALQIHADSSILVALEKKISAEISYLQQHAHIKIFPIKKLVQLQLLMLFETTNALHREHKESETSTTDIA